MVRFPFVRTRATPKAADAEPSSDVSLDADPAAVDALWSAQKDADAKAASAADPVAETLASTLDDLADDRGFIDVAAGDPLEEDDADGETKPRSEAGGDKKTGAEGKAKPVFETIMPSVGFDEDVALDRLAELGVPSADPSDAPKSPRRAEASDRLTLRNDQDWEPSFSATDDDPALSSTLAEHVKRIQELDISPAERSFSALDEPSSAVLADDASAARDPSPNERESDAPRVSGAVDQKSRPAEPDGAATETTDLGADRGAPKDPDDTGQRVERGRDPLGGFGVVHAVARARQADTPYRGPGRSGEQEELSRSDHEPTRAEEAPAVDERDPAPDRGFGADDFDAVAYDALAEEETLRAADDGAATPSGQKVATDEAAVDEIVIGEIATGESATEETATEAIATVDGEGHAAPSLEEQTRMVEAMLFASETPLSTAELGARMPVGCDPAVAVRRLEQAYETRGVRVVRVAGKWAFRTAPDLAYLMMTEAVESRKLSKAAIETLAIVAYHQPVTRAEIEEIRQVSVSKGTIDLLMELEWIKLGRRRQTPGRPVTFISTEKFLDHFGLESTKDLPGLDELRQAGLLDNRPAIGPNPGEGEPLEIELEEDEEEDDDRALLV